MHSRSKDSLRRKVAGSVISYEPKIIWVKMMGHLNGTSKSLRLRGTFNACLECLLAKKVGHFIMDVEQAMADVTFFDSDNKLNNYGRVQFWSDLDKQIEKFEKRIITLKPFTPRQRSFPTSAAGSSRPPHHGRRWFRRGGLRQ